MDDRFHPYCERFQSGQRFLQKNQFQKDFISAYHRIHRCNRCFIIGNYNSCDDNGHFYLSRESCNAAFIDLYRSCFIEGRLKEHSFRQGYRDGAPWKICVESAGDGIYYICFRRDRDDNRQRFAPDINCSSCCTGVNSFADIGR